MPAAPGSCCCSTRRCTSSTASRCPSRRHDDGPSAEQLERGRAPCRGRRRRRRVRAALRGHVLPRPRRRARSTTFKQGWGDDRRLDRRRRRRRPVELPRAHQRHRRGDRGRARPRRPAAPDPGHRPVRGGRRRARAPRGGDGRRLVAVRRTVDRRCRRSRARSSPSPAATAWSSCSATSACRAWSPAGRR